MINILMPRTSRVQTPIKTFARSAKKWSRSEILEDTIELRGQKYAVDSWTNISPAVTSKLDRRLHLKKPHPLNLIQQRIRNHFHKTYVRVGNPEFTIVDNLSPIVTTKQNFDSLLVPKDHVSRLPSDSYYINEEVMLRAHTSAHQEDLIKMGLDSFLCIGDVYRRDSIDSSHFPVFHQCEGVRLFTEQRLSRMLGVEDGRFFENEDRTELKQGFHTAEAVQLVENDLKDTLLKMTYMLFGTDIEAQWVSTYFPFTHPSWELEIKYQDKWLEVLGCGVMEQELLRAAGAPNQIGWAFGLGLERLAMKLYSIPDIRMFWSEKTAFLNQFKVDDPDTPITFKPLTEQPTCYNDISFWVPENFSPNDFYDLVRNIGGDMIEEVNLFDEFFHPKHKKNSQCYRIVYRHMERPVTQVEVNQIHDEITEAAKSDLGVIIR